MRTVAGVATRVPSEPSRYGIGTVVSERYPGAFPVGTFLTNVTGSFLLGLLFVVLTERSACHPLGGPR